MCQRIEPAQRERTPLPQTRSVRTARHQQYRTMEEKAALKETALAEVALEEMTLDEADLEMGTMAPLLLTPVIPMTLLDGVGIV